MLAGISRVHGQPIITRNVKHFLNIECLAVEIPTEKPQEIIVTVIGSVRWSMGIIISHSLGVPHDVGIWK